MNTHFVIFCGRKAWGNGASDDISGTVTMMEIARALSVLRDEYNWSPRRSLMFGSWDGMLIEVKMYKILESQNQSEICCWTISKNVFSFQFLVFSGPLPGFSIPRAALRTMAAPFVQQDLLR